MDDPMGGGEPGNGQARQEDQLRELARSGEEFIAIGDDGDGQVVIVVGVPDDQAEALTQTTGVSVGRVEDDDIERIVLAFFADDGDPNEQEPAFVLALAPAVPEERDHLATLARAAEASLVVLEVPSGDRRAVRSIGDRALDELREFAREAGVEGA
jgi:hypothetical protein